MRAIAPRTGHEEVTYAENQLEYMAITVARVEHGNGRWSLLTRWTLTPAERERVARGADIYVAQTNWGQPMTPMNVWCGPGPFVWCVCADRKPDPKTELCQQCGSSIPPQEK